MVKRAKSVLADMVENGTVKPIAQKKQAEASLSMSFEDIATYEIADRIKKVDLNTLTPIEAMNFIFELKKLFNQ